MGEEFLVNIDCSKIFQIGSKQQYTMFVDGTKMSIVYEFVEWIRWVFSIETCFYLTHQDSVIHELEAIQVLSRLKDFIANPCEGSHCFHNKPYKTFLESLNLFVYWNGIKMHKYFLQKIDQVDGKFFCERKGANPKDFNCILTNKQSLMQLKSAETNNFKKYNSETTNSFVFENEMSESCEMLLNKELKLQTNQKSSGEMNSFSKKQTLNKNSEDFGLFNNSHFITTDNLSLETKQTNDSAVSNYSSLKNKLKRKLKTSSHSIKSHSEKHIRPFSLGEVLSKLKNEILEIKHDDSTLAKIEEKNFDEKVINIENSPVTNIRTGVQKRHRTRKRKKSKKEKELVSPVTVNCGTKFSVNVSNEQIFKPNHIRCDIGVNNDFSEIECHDKNEFDVSVEKTNDFRAFPFFESESEKLVASTNDNNEHLSYPAESSLKVTSTENKIEYSYAGDREDVPEQLTDCHDEASVMATDGELNCDIHNTVLNSLLYLKKKFKTAVVIERFH